MNTTDDDLKAVYEQLKDRYELTLTNALSLNAGFDWDMQVLTGESSLGRFYLCDNGANLVFDYDTDEGISGAHWHPESIEDAIKYVIHFMEGRIGL